MSTQKAIMHKMLKQNKVSPNTYQNKKQKLEIWVNEEKDKLNKQKQEFKNVFQNTIDIINNTNKNKDRIKEMLSKSKSRRPGIWSDYSNSFASIGQSPHANISLQNPKMLLFGLNDQSNNSFVFSGDKYKNDDSVNSGLIDIKKTLKDRLKNLVKHKLKKEIEIKQPEKLVKEEPKIEIVNFKRSQESSGVGIETPDEKPVIKKQLVSIVDQLNIKLEKSQELKSEDRNDHITLDAKINELESDKSAYSPETPKEKFQNDDDDNSAEDQDISDVQKHISIKDILPDPISKIDAIEELNEQSKWLETYLKKEKEAQLKAKEYQILFDEDDPERDTPEGVIDEPMSNKISNNMGVLLDEYSTPRSLVNPNSEGETDKDDIPAISYSDDDRNNYKDRNFNDYQVHEKEENSDDSDSQNLDNKNSDLIVSKTPPLESSALEKEKRADVITNDLFYEILADIITDPIPKRDLSIFALQPLSGQRKLVDPEKRKPFDLFTVEKYLEEVIESIMENESGFIDNLLEPVRRNPIDMLQLLQNSDLGSYEHFENIALKQPVLNLDLYLDIERNKEERRLTEQTNKNIIKHLDRTNSNSGSTSDDNEEQVEYEQIHRKMVFDSINCSIN